MRTTSWWLCAALLMACSNEPSPDGGTGDVDAGVRDDAGPAVCSSTAECDDGAYCNGAESCDPSHADADASGCVAGEAPCEGMTCDEDDDACSTCAEDADGDNDGFDAVTCGGDDCDDTSGGVRPDADEVCDDVDNDCSGTVDDVPSADLPRWYADTDGDGYGSGEPTLSCDRPSGTYVTEGGDCDEGSTAIHPGADEVPDDLTDNDCNGRVDDIGTRLRGGILSLGGALTRGARRVVAPRFEGLQRRCVGTRCIRGSIAP